MHAIKDIKDKFLFAVNDLDSLNRTENVFTR